MTAFIVLLFKTFFFLNNFLFLQVLSSSSPVNFLENTNPYKYYTEFAQSDLHAKHINFNSKLVMLPDNKTIISTIFRKDYIASFVVYDINSSKYAQDFKIPFKHEFFIGKHLCEAPGTTNIDLPFGYYINGNEVVLSIFLASSSESEYQDYNIKGCENEYMTLYIIKYNYISNTFTLQSKKDNYFLDPTKFPIDNSLNKFTIVKDILQLDQPVGQPPLIACLVILTSKTDL